MKVKMALRNKELCFGFCKIYVRCYVKNGINLIVDKDKFLNGKFRLHR